MNTDAPRPDASRAPARLTVDREFCSPYALSAYVALREKDVPFELAAIDLAGGQQHQAAFATRAVTRRVPLLELDGFELTESSAIAEYLDEAFPARGAALYPRGLRDRARARQVQAWLRSDLGALREERSTATVFIAPSGRPLSPAGRAAADKLVAAAEALVPADAGAMFGDWCIADTDLAMMLQRLLASGDPLPDRLAAYARAQWARPAVAAWRALPRPAAHPA